MNNECDIVKDLLFSYDEEILSNTSKEFVENHLKNCDNCKNILDEIKKQNNDNYNLKEIDFLKKIKKKMNKRNILLAITSMLLIIIIVIVLIYLSSYVRRVIIINDLKDKSKEYDNLTNYSYTLETTYKSGYSKSVNRYFVKDNEFYAEQKVYFSNGKESNEHAYCDGSIDFFVEVDGQRFISTNRKEDAIIGGLVPFNLTYLGKSINTYDIEKIEENSENGKEYYIITTKANNTKYFIEKDTGITVKIIDDFSIIEMSYEIGNVSEDDIVKINNNMTLEEWFWSNVKK